MRPDQMGALTSAASESIQHQWHKHTVAGATAAAGGAEMALSDTIQILPSWLPIGEMAAVAGLTASCMLIYKTFVEIKIKRIELARMDRRKDR